MSSQSADEASLNATIDFLLPDDGWVKLAIFTLQGSLVRTIRNEPLTSGTYYMKWDGIDDKGRAVQAGPYIARLEA